MDDVTLTFNPNIFLDSLKKISLGLAGVDSSFKQFADNSTKNAKKTEVSTLSIAKGIGVAQIAMTGFRKLMSFAPEIGRTFSIAGSIITRNLLWPLRQELIPILQKVLDWVRDNRAMFVRWGNIVANIFRVIKTVVSGMVNLLQRLWDGFMSGLQRAFGGAVRNMENLANLMLFKIAAVVNFLMILLEPVAETIGKMFAQSLEYLGEFVTGFASGFGKIGDIFEDFISSLRLVVNLFSNLLGKGNSLNLVFKSFGFIIGTVVGGAIRGLITILDSIALGIITTVGVVKQAIAKLKGNNAEANRIRKETDRDANLVASRIKKRWEDQKRITMSGFRELGSPDTGGGRVKQIETGTINNRTSSSVVNQNVTVNNTINGNQNPQATADEVSKQLRNQLSKEKARAGRSRS